MRSMPSEQNGTTLCKQFNATCAARGRVADDADLMAEFRLPARQIAHMAKQSADRSSEDVQDFHGRAAPG